MLATLVSVQTDDHSVLVTVKASVVAEHVRLLRVADDGDTAEGIMADSAKYSALIVVVRGPTPPQRCARSPCRNHEGAIHPSRPIFLERICYLKDGPKDDALAFPACFQPCQDAGKQRMDVTLPREGAMLARLMQAAVK